MARQEKLFRKADTDAKRLIAANQALARGDIKVAGLIYARLASSRVPNLSTGTAKMKLIALQTEATKKLDELDRKLKDARRTSSDYVSPGITNVPGDMGSIINRAIAAQPRGSEHTAVPEQASREAENLGGGAFDQVVDWQAVSAGAEGGIVVVFREYDRLAVDYGDLPKVGSQIKAHVEKLRQQPENAAVLNELAAASLWTLGQKHERDDQLCCAYWVYKRAAELVPAPSAILAKNRFTELAENHEVVASAKTCRELQWCHKAYLRAEQLLEAKPENAAELFAEIVRRAPEDSEVYREAKKHVY
jgi:hypothetical protein